ncbi:MAG: RidA family protein [Alphaproteobacteria bacterium]|nr:RidA family protein [Alphaproteobacteria bacterium]
MAHKKHNPKTIAKPVSAFSHAMEVAPGARWLYVSGQVGTSAKGKLSPGIKGQCDRAWRNLIAVLKAADMELKDVVKITVFLTRPEDLTAYREVRDRHLGRVRPAWTLVFVSQLANPDWLVEIEAVAAKC